MTRQAVIFDLDDTLFLERDYVRSGMSAVAAWAAQHWGFDAPAAFAELWQLIEQGVRGNTFDTWLSQHGRHTPENVDALVRVYRGHEPRIAPLPEAVAVLESLAPGWRLGLVSDGWLEVQKKKWNSLGLQDRFSAVVFSDALGRDAWKPSPKAFRAALDQLQIEPQNAVYVADNPAKDFLGPRTLGMRSVRFRHRDGLYCRSEPVSAEYAPDAEIAALAALPAILTGRALDRANWIAHEST